jgi:hypothetical protein
MLSCACLQGRIIRVCSTAVSRTASFQAWKSTLEEASVIKKTKRKCTLCCACAERKGRWMGFGFGSGLRRRLNYARAWLATSGEEGQEESMTLGPRIGG